MAHALNLLTGFSVTPLRLASLVGVGAALCGLCALIYALLRSMLGGTTNPGFLFLTSIITLFSGTQIFCASGEYLGRVYLPIIDRPAYLVRREISGRQHGGEKIAIALACAGRRGLLFLRRLRELVPEANLAVFSFREESYEPPFLDEIVPRVQEPGHRFLETRKIDGNKAAPFWDELGGVDLMFVVGWHGHDQSQRAL